jgi:hypothetical protein
MCTTHPDIINPDLLAFVRGEPVSTGMEASPTLLVEA